MMGGTHFESRRLYLESCFFFVLAGNGPSTIPNNNSRAVKSFVAGQAFSRGKCRQAPFLYTAVEQHVLGDSARKSFPEWTRS